MWRFRNWFGYYGATLLPPLPQKSWNCSLVQWRCSRKASLMVSKQDASSLGVYFSSIYIFVTSRWPTVAEICRQHNKVWYKAAVFWHTPPPPWAASSSEGRKMWCRVWERTAVVACTPLEQLWPVHILGRIRSKYYVYLWVLLWCLQDSTGRGRTVMYVGGVCYTNV